MDNISKATGIIGVIACPMLEDELIYDLVNDMDEKDIYIVDTGSHRSFVSKLENNNISYQMISEYSFDHGIQNIDHSKLNFVICMNALGLHENPKNLRSQIETQVLLHARFFDALLVFYGLCGNFGWDISEYALDKAETPVITIRSEDGRVCDDCIGVAVGGTDNYLRLNRAYTGVLYLTPAMATNWDDFMGVSEFAKGLKRYDRDMLRMIFEMCGYKNALKLDTGIGDQENYLRCAEEVCNDMNLILIDPDGEWTTLDPVKKAYDEAKKALSIKR